MFLCECGKEFKSEGALSQHVEATGHAFGGLNPQLDSAAVSDEFVPTDRKVEDGGLVLEIARIEGNEALVRFVCGACEWPVEEGQRSCVFCGEPLVWGDKDGI